MDELVEKKMDKAKGQTRKKKQAVLLYYMQ
jgi:hypothetical protein